MTHTRYVCARVKPNLTYAYKFVAK